MSNTDIDLATSLVADMYEDLTDPDFRQSDWDPTECSPQALRDAVDSLRALIGTSKVETHDQALSFAAQVAASI